MNLSVWMVDKKADGNPIYAKNSYPFKMLRN